MPKEAPDGSPSLPPHVQRSCFYPRGQVLKIRIPSNVSPFTPSRPGAPRRAAREATPSRPALLFLLAFSAAIQSSAQANKPSVTLTPQPPADTRVPLISQPLHLSDFESMKPRPGLESQLTHISGFIQTAPNSETAPTQTTEVWTARTASTIYFVFACHDTNPGAIRGHLARRENISDDDSVTVLLDPFQDRRKGVLFSVNPSGVQADAAWTEGDRPDYSYDQVWDSEARLNPGGWLGLIAIPFRSLRFRPGIQDWGVVFTRNLPRNSERDRWPHISPNITGLLSQEGILHAIESGTRSHNLQLNPYFLAQNEHRLLTLDPANPYFSTRKLEGTGGGDAKLIIKDSLVLDATVNPDFSTVESDQPQFTVNQRYPVYFPELRPFFLENANFFTTPIQLVYTRNIAHPEYGARLTGKIDRTNLGLLAIDDRQPGEIAPPTDPLHGKPALFAVGRLSQDLGKNSSIGLIYTDKEFAGSWNRIGGLDFTARLNDKWTADGQVVESSTRATDGSYSAGPGTNFNINRSGHSFDLNTSLADFSTGFQTQLGFIQTNNIRSDQNYIHYIWFPKHSLFQSIGLESDSSIAFDHQNNRLYHNLGARPFFSLARNTILVPLVGHSSDTLGAQNYPALTHPKNLSENFLGFVVRSAPLPQLSFNIVATHGGNPNYNPVGGIPTLLHQDMVRATVTLRPLPALSIDNTYLLDRNFAPAHNTFVFENQTLRTKLNYQFTRALSARVIVEYDTLHANRFETTLRRTKQVSTQALITWLPHPGTAIYLGYNNDLQNFNHTLCSRIAAGTCSLQSPILPRSSQYLNDGRQFFLKLSYLLRL